MKIKYVTLLLMIICFVVVSYSYADKVHVVEGIIERVMEDSIVVRGKYYGITGVPLVDSSGKTKKKTELITGNKVEIFIEDRNVSSILIHDNMLE
ncbi:MAG: hypothetical protein C4538_01380 [Nitrospiraceae bacterium]|nr:MAG: hypothetical protein C4538_01380 [Nitrospiraceae bacterium]